jgi:DNA-binding Lrp family transcriptional regulator
MAFRQELCVKYHGGKKVLFTPTDIAEETGLSKQHVRRSLEELENQGLAERKPINGKSLTKGNVAIYSWAEPRTPREQNSSHPRLPFPDWFSPSLQPLRALIQRYKYELPADLVAAGGYLSALEEAAREVEKAEKVACDILDRVCAGAAHIRKKEQESTEEKNPPPQPSVKATSNVEEEENTQALIPLPEPAAPAVIEAQFVPEEPTFQQFAEDYPGEVDPDSKPVYEALTPQDKTAIQQTLPTFKSCERWKTPRFIPRASNFLKKRYWEFPPPRARIIESLRKQESREQAQSILSILKARRGI